MNERDDDRVATKIGDRTYYGTHFRDPDLQQLILAWQDLGYSKFSDLDDQMEWAIVETLLLEETFELRFVVSSYVEYPSFPDRDTEQGKKLLGLFRQAKAHRDGFDLRDRRQDESMRAYFASVADALEHHLTGRLPRADASIAADFFLSRCVRDRPCGYDE